MNDPLPKVATVGQRVKVETLRTGEGVGDHTLARNLETPEVLLAVRRVREEAFVLALVT